MNRQHSLTTRQPGRDRLVLLSFFAVALLVRVAAVFLLWFDTKLPLTYEHGQIARNIVEGRGFAVCFLGQEGPTSQQAPFYPYFLAGLYAVFGIETKAALLAAQLIQAAIGSLAVLLAAWLTRNSFPGENSAPYWAAAIAAFFPPHIYMVTHIQVVTWCVILLLLALCLATDRRIVLHRWGTIACGAVCGAMLLVDPILVLAVPVCVFAVAQRSIAATDRRCFDKFFSRDQLFVLARGALLLLVCGLVISPWLVRNYVVHGEFVFVKSTFWYAFWQGNNPASWGTDKIPKPTAEIMRHAHSGQLRDVNRALWNARHETVYIDDVLLKPGGYKEFAGLTEPERCRVLRDRALQFIRRAPRRYLSLCLRRARYWFFFDETNPKARHWLYRWSSWFWLSTTLLGLIVAGRRLGTAWPMVGVAAGLSLFHILVIVSARFRMPVEAACLPLMALAAASVVSFLRRLFSAAM